MPAPPPAPTGRTAGNRRCRINAKGGILGKQVEIVRVRHADQSGNTRAAVQRGIDEGAYAILGPIFSGPIGASMQISAARRGRRRSSAARRAGFTAKGNPYIFRTSISSGGCDAEDRQIHEGDAEGGHHVAVVWVNNDFGKGGRDTILPELEKAAHQGRRRRLDRAGPGRLHRRRDRR